MKIYVSLFILFFAFSVFGDVYYCVVEKNTGFSWTDNYKTHSKPMNANNLTFVWLDKNFC